MLRKIIRNSLKKELGTNSIREEFHRRYGHQPNVSKLRLKEKAREDKRKKKEAKKAAKQKA